MDGPWTVGSLTLGGPGIPALPSSRKDGSAGASETPLYFRAAAYRLQ
jgi:hypothetical protein